MSMNTPSNTPQQTPPAPANTEKMIKTGWNLVGLSGALIIVGLFFGIALAISALVAAFAARLGLQAKYKPLAVTALVVCVIAFALFTLTYFANR